MFSQPGNQFGFAKGNIFQPQQPPNLGTPEIAGNQPGFLNRMSSGMNQMGQNFRNVRNDDEKRRQLLAFVLSNGGGIGGMNGLR